MYSTTGRFKQPAQAKAWNDWSLIYSPQRIMIHWNLEYYQDFFLLFLKISWKIDEWASVGKCSVETTISRMLEYYESFYNSTEMVHSQHRHTLSLLLFVDGFWLSMLGDGYIHRASRVILYFYNYYNYRIIIVWNILLLHIIL